MNKKNVLKSVIIQKEKNNEVLLTSIIIAFGINVFSTGILGLLNLESNYYILILLGTFLSIMIFLIYQICLIKKENNRINICGTLIYDEKNNELIDIPEYSIINEMINFLKAACTENKALEKKWKKSKIGIDINNNNNNNNIIIELIEYLIINQLEMSLNDYYTINNIKKNNIKTYNIDEIPTLLKKNRFLKIFAEDMENRAAFIDQAEKNNEKKRKIIFAIGENGEIFNKFELKLPKEVKMKKNKLDEFEFCMKYFDLNIKYEFGKSNSVVDPEFYNNYLKIPSDIMRYNDLNFKIKINIKIKPKILFSKKKIENYMWLDEFLYNLINYADINNFYNRINWESNKCIIRCLYKKEK